MKRSTNTPPFKQGALVDLYIRSATYDEIALSRQEIALRSFCDLNKATIRNVIVEVYVGNTFDRPKWRSYQLEILRSGKRRDTNIFLLVTTWDRFSRSLCEKDEMERWLSMYGIQPFAITS